MINVRPRGRSTNEFGEACMSGASDSEANRLTPGESRQGQNGSYRFLGKTGIAVSPLCLGAMMFGPYGNPDVAECMRIVHRAFDSGINFIDTADAYSSGESEKIV